MGTGGPDRRPRQVPPPATVAGKQRRSRRSGGGDVVAGPWTSSTRSGPTGSLPQPPPSVQASSDQAELDAILDKISELGMDGLTGDEKSRLNELSKRMRGADRLRQLRPIVSQADQTRQSNSRR